MTNDEKRIAIAEKCGWVRDEVCDCWRNPSEGVYAVAFLNTGHAAYRQLPNYPEDLNACREMWLTLPTCKRATFDGHLCVVTGEFEDEEWDTTLVTNATAAQRCDAFLLTHGYKL